MGCDLLTYDRVYVGNLAHSLVHDHTKSICFFAEELSQHSTDSRYNEDACEGNTDIAGSKMSHISRSKFSP